MRESQIKVIESISVWDYFILREFNSIGSTSIAFIADRLKICHKKLRADVRALIKAGFMRECEEKGSYYLPEKGTEALREVRFAFGFQRL